MVTPDHPSYPEQVAQQARLAATHRQIQQDRMTQHNTQKAGNAK